MIKLPPKAKVLIVTDITSDAELVKGVLNEEFEQVFTSTDPSKMSADFVRHRPDVLVLAFNKLEKSERYRLKLHQFRLRTHPHRTVVLCNKDEVKRASELCMQDYFDNYILFWPMTYDSPRLNVSVYSALRELAANKADIPSAAEFIERMRNMADLKQNQQPLQVDQHINTESHGAAQAKHIRPRVLVVDDDEFQHKIIGKLLVEKNYLLTFATSGFDALEMMLKEQPDLVLMDVMMPDMDGIDVTRNMKSLPQLARIPVIMITGKSEGQVVIDSLKAGATDFVVKPFDRATLIAKMDRVLGRTKI